MEQKKRNQAIGFLLIICYLVGMVCGCMMIHLQLTEDAKASTDLILEQWTFLQRIELSWEQLGILSFRFATMGWFLTLLSFCLGLWMIGQPFILLLFSVLGLQCGCYGMALMQDKSTFILLWYLPVMICLLFALLPVGIQGVYFSIPFKRITSPEGRFRRYLLLTLKQLLMIGLTAAAAGIGYRLYGCALLQ